MLLQKLPLVLYCTIFTLVSISDAKNVTLRFRAPKLPNKNVRVRIRRLNSTSTTPPPPLKVSEVCGLSAINLIQSGDNVQPGEFPWLGALFIGNAQTKTYLCTVNLVTTNHLVTAAHCLSLSPNPEDYHVVLGFLMPEPHLQMFISQIASHPLYRKSGAAHDIAILSLNTTVAFSHILRPICLGKQGMLGDNTRGTVAGFGPDYSTYRKVSMPLVAISRCHDSNELFRAIVNDNTFCAGDRNNSGPCKGDSGAGYMQYSDERLYLRGIVSLSLQNNGTCNLRQYIIFADVLRDSDWIRITLKGFLT